MRDIGNRWIVYRPLRPPNYTYMACRIIGDGEIVVVDGHICVKSLQVPNTSVSIARGHLYDVFTSEREAAECRDTLNAVMEVQEQ